MIDIRRAVADGHHTSYIVLSTSTLMENLLSAVMSIYIYIYIHTNIYRLFATAIFCFSHRSGEVTWCLGTSCTCFYGYGRPSVERSRLIYWRRCACASSPVPGRDCECGSPLINNNNNNNNIVTLVLPPYKLRLSGHRDPARQTGAEVKDIGNKTFSQDAHYLMGGAAELLQ